MTDHTLLVTGAAGFIGCNFVSYYLNKHPEDKIVGLDLLTYAANQDFIRDTLKDPRFSFYHDDICNTALVEKILKDHRADILVNFAAESHVDRSIADPDIFIKSNILGTYSLLSACRHVWMSDSCFSGLKTRFHHISTDEVYGSLELDDNGFTETSPYRPSSPYSASKASSDLLVQAFVKTYGLNATISNCSNNYGPYQHPEKFIPLAVTRMLRGEQVPMYGDGCQIRDWLFVEDHCRGIELILNSGISGETYNIGSCNEHANIEVLTMLSEILTELFKEDPGLSLKFPNCPAADRKSCLTLVTRVTDRPGHDRRYGIDNTKIVRELGFCASVEFHSGLKNTVRWIIDSHSS